MAEDVTLGQTVGKPCFVVDSEAGMIPLRDYFAAQAIRGLLEIRGWGGDAESKRRIAAEAYDFADAMILERNKS